MRPLTLDHVAFWVADRASIVERCERYLGMHVIDEQESFTLVGADARRGKLTFFDAEGPRSRGVDSTASRIVMRSKGFPAGFCTTRAGLRSVTISR